MRHRAIAFPITVVATLLFATSVLAGGWAQVTIVDPPVDPGPGTPTTVTFTVMQHGETPISWANLTVVATDPGSGTAVRTDAKPTGPTGQYAATITFPSAGAWRLTFESTDLIMDGQATLTVVPVVPVAAANAAAAAAAETAPVVDPLAIGLVAISVLTLLTVIAVAVRGRPGRREKSAVASG